MVRRKILSAVLLMFMLVYGCIQADGYAETLPVVTHLEENRFSCSFDGVKHDFILDLPKKTEGAPLVLMLPGYGNTAESFRSSVLKLLHFISRPAAIRRQKNFTCIHQFLVLANFGIR